MNDGGSGAAGKSGPLAARLALNWVRPSAGSSVSVSVSICAVKTGLGTTWLPARCAHARPLLRRPWGQNGHCVVCRDGQVCPPPSAPSGGGC